MNSNTNFFDLFVNHRSVGKNDNCLFVYNLLLIFI